MEFLWSLESCGDPVEFLLTLILVLILVVILVLILIMILVDIDQTYGLFFNEKTILRLKKSSSVLLLFLRYLFFQYRILRVLSHN